MHSILAVLRLFYFALFFLGGNVQNALFTLGITARNIYTYMHTYIYTHTHYIYIIKPCKIV